MSIRVPVLAHASNNIFDIGAVMFCHLLESLLTNKKILSRFECYTQYHTLIWVSRTFSYTHVKQKSVSC